MTSESVAPLAFDPDALRRKYREERDKRLRTEGNQQYIEIKDQFGHYLGKTGLPFALQPAHVIDMGQPAVGIGIVGPHHRLGGWIGAELRKLAENPELGQAGPGSTTARAMTMRPCNGL